MAEGDTIFRLAQKLGASLMGKEVTDAQSRAGNLGIQRLNGSKLDSIEPRGKHLLMRFSGALTLHTHMRMNGSWEIYKTGESWKKPEWQAKVVLTFGEQVAVCFNAPVVELFETRYEKVHKVLRALGPDILHDPLDKDEIFRRVSGLEPNYTIGEMLMNQRVVSGIGNIFRAEALFITSLDPWMSISELNRGDFDRLIDAAAALMQTSVSSRRNMPAVYKRTGRPCQRCGTPIKSTKLGDPPRTIYWCTACQPQS